MNCHRDIQKNNPKLQPVRDSWATGQPITWVKIHNVPDYAYFNHSVHVNRGVSCVVCHGKVNEMSVVFQHESQSMGWCLQCHRNPQEYVRPIAADKSGETSPIFNLNWTPPDGTTQAQIGRKLVHDWKINPPQNCAGCHR
jgi:formate-dependent nitrite reductase cytochrome c552 subunit